MKYTFYKYQGTGNDFVMIDNRESIFDGSNLEVVSKLCDRKFGIGADGLILIENHESLDFEMVYFNADGTQSFCGNGSRCAVAFAKFLGIIDTETRFNAIDGEHEAVIKKNIVEIKMGNVSQVESVEEHYFIQTGSPHYIVYHNEIQEIDIINESHKIRYNSRFCEQGTNVNYVQKNEDNLAIRTYERGVEDETLSCGTGATAVALSGALKYDMQSPISIKVQGGELEIKFDKISDQIFNNIWLIGKAEFVFSGEVEI